LEEHPDTLTNMANLASTYWGQGEWTRAERLQSRVVEMRKKILGKGHPDTLAAMDDLVLNYQFQGRWNAAEKLEIQIMAGRLRVLEL
jgi:hypothetical protein